MTRQRRSAQRNPSAPGRLYDAGVIAAIIKIVGTAQISQGGTLDGTEIVWLSDKLTETLDRLEVVVQDAPVIRATSRGA